VAMYLMREEANATLLQIGASFGGRDHTTVMYACDKVAAMIEKDDLLRRRVFLIRDNLYNARPLLEGYSFLASKENLQAFQDAWNFSVL
jgi:hypothetical protein